MVVLFGAEFKPLLKWKNSVILPAETAAIPRETGYNLPNLSPLTELELS